MESRTATMVWELGEERAGSCADLRLAARVAAATAHSARRRPFRCVLQPSVPTLCAVASPSGGLPLSLLTLHVRRLCVQTATTLLSYLSEPPSKMAAMKAYTHELLAQQGGGEDQLGEQQPQRPAPLPPVPPFQFGPQQQQEEPLAANEVRARRMTPRAGAALRVGQLSDGMKQLGAEALASRQHFSIPATLATSPRRATEPAVDAARGPVSTTPHPQLRTSIGKAGSRCLVR